MYKQNFLLLIERREIVTDIYNKIENEIIQFFIIYGDSGVGKFNFAFSLFVTKLVISLLVLNNIKK